MGTTPVCFIDQSGIHRPDLATVLAYINQSYWSVYGADVSLDAASEDGEFCGLLAAAIDDGNQMACAVYNAYSPATAQGAGLSSVVKINGLSRAIPSNSSVPLLIVGQATAEIASGLLGDGVGFQWALPASVVIPLEGQITVTAICTTPGAIALSSGVIMTMINPTRGWQSATTTANATLGAPVETDAQLRLRQSHSTQAPSSTMLGGIDAAIRAIPGVARLRCYQNVGSIADVNGIPGHSIAIVADGGDALTIAQTIALRKFAAGTYGTTIEWIIDAYGVNHPINFFYVSEPEVTWGVSIRPGATFSTNTIALIQASMAAYTTGLGIGIGVQLSRAYAAAYLTPSIAAASAALQAAVAAGDNAGIASQAALIASLNATALTYEVMSLTAARDGSTLAPADVLIAFNEAAQTVAGDVTVTLV